MKIPITIIDMFGKKSKATITDIDPEKGITIKLNIEEN